MGQRFWIVLRFGENLFEVIDHDLLQLLRAGGEYAIRVHDGVEVRGQLVALQHAMDGGSRVRVHRGARLVHHALLLSADG